MGRTLQPFILLCTSTLTLATNPEPELPLCPTTFQYFPQDLPMHCRMPPGAINNFPNLPKLPILPTFPPPFYQSPPPEKQPQPIPFPVPPSFPGPMFPGPGPVPLPPPGVPISMPMPIGMPGPSQKLPVIVMPFYSPDPSYNKPDHKVPDHNNKERKKRRKIRIHVNKRRRKSHKYRTASSESSSDTDTTDTDTSSDTGVNSDSDWWDGGNTRRSNGRRRTRKKNNRIKEPVDLLTPVIQYVTKDGYVIYEKEISKNEARDWLHMKNQERDDNKVPYTELDELTEKDAEEVNVEKIKDIRPKEVKSPMRSPMKMRRRHKNVNKPQQQIEE